MLERRCCQYALFPGELTVEKSLPLRNTRLVIPKTLQPEILEKLHVGHLGIVKCSATNRCLLNMGFLHQYAVTMDPSFPQTFSDSLQEKVSSQTTYGQDASEQLSLSFHLRSNQVGLTCGGWDRRRKANETTTELQQTTQHYDLPSA